MKVREIMTNNPVTVRPDATVAQVIEQVLARGLSGVPVLDTHGQLLGIITKRDLVARHAHPHVPLYLGILGGVLPIETRHNDEEMRRVLATTAGDLMTRDPLTIDADATVEDLADLMADHDANPVPVMEGDRLVGIASYEDILRLLATEEGTSDGSEQSG
jgi:predicted transcriptional regulator